jgi:hypothetical protein
MIATRKIQHLPPAMYRDPRTVVFLNHSMSSVRWSKPLATWRHPNSKSGAVGGLGLSLDKGRGIGVDSTFL